VELHQQPDRKGGAVATAEQDDRAALELLSPFLDQHSPRGHVFAQNMPASTPEQRHTLRVALRDAAPTHPEQVRVLRAYLNGCAAEQVVWRRDVLAALDYLRTLEG
jgi:hypothetical protein